MNTRSTNPSLIRHLGIMVAGLSLACILTASGVEKTNLPSGPSQSATNAKPASIEIPLSQFTIPTVPSEGRNPFFPDSILTLKVNPNANTNSAVKVTVALVLQGISGTATKRFALINGATFEPGEAHTVTIGRSRVQVVCISIKDDAVTVEVDGNRQELKLRPGL